MVKMTHIPCYLESEKQRAENFSQRPCIQEIFAGGLTNSEEMFEQILECEPILRRYIWRSDQFLQQLSIFLWALHFCKQTDKWFLKPAQRHSSKMKWYVAPLETPILQKKKNLSFIRTKRYLSSFKIREMLREE